MFSDDLAFWPSYLYPVFATLHSAMAGKRLSPSVLADFSSRIGAMMPDHQVALTHLDKAATADRSGRYVLVITGSRIDGEWRFLSGQLERLAAKAALQQG